MTDAPIHSQVRDSLWFSKAQDGDVLVVVEYAGIDRDAVVDVVMAGGRLRLRQGRRVFADLEALGEHAEFLGSAPRLSVMEVEYGETPDDDRFVLHPAARLVVGPEIRT